LNPKAIGFLGYSYGGYLATYLGARDVRARALAVFGGTGVLHAARAAGEVLSPDLTTRLFRNAEDAVPDPDRYCAALPAEYHATVAAPLDGGHSFDTYARNGTVRAAFAFALGRLR
jgi:dienelactone hydrolase